MSFESVRSGVEVAAETLTGRLKAAIEMLKRGVDPETETVRALNLAGELLDFSEKMQEKIEEIIGEFSGTYEELKKVVNPEDQHTISINDFGAKSDVLTPVGTFMDTFEYVKSFRFKEHIDDLKSLADIKENEFLGKEGYKRIEEIFEIFSGYMKDGGLEKDLDDKSTVLVSNFGSVEEFLKDKKNEGGEYTE